MWGFFYDSQISLKLLNLHDNILRGYYCEEGFYFCKKVINYIEGRYGKAYQSVFKTMVCRDHDIDQLMIMYKRLEANIENEKIPKLTNNLLVVFVTVFLTFIPTYFLVILLLNQESSTQYE